MRKLYVIFLVLLLNLTYLGASTWDECIEKYNKAKRFSENSRLSYIYLKSTKNCLVKFRDSLIQAPDPDFTIKAMNNNIAKLEKYINDLIPKYTYPENSLESIPLYITKNAQPIYNKEYKHFIKFNNNCNGVHADNKIYTAKHCNITESKNAHFDLDYIEAKTVSKLKTSKLDLTKKGTFKYYSMSKEGMFYNVLLQEKNCRFYKAKNEPTGLNTTLDLTDLVKKDEIRSNCLAIPSNSGGGVFQEGRLVGIISKTVFNENSFLYSVVEPIIPLQNNNLQLSNSAY